MNSVWGGRLGFKASEGKSIAEMIDSLLHEEIRKPIALALVAGFGQAGEPPQSRSRA